MVPTEVAAVAVVMLAGFMRGMTGFGGAMLMAPSLSLLLGPVPAVVIALALESAAAAVMFADALPRIQGRSVLYLTVPACLTVPIGGYFLLTLDPVLARKAIAAAVALFSLMLLTGFRYSGAPRPSTSVALSLVVGVLLGATSVGAPPIIIYLLAGGDPPSTTLVNLTVIVTAISVMGMVMLMSAGIITRELALQAVGLTFPFLAATWVGGRMYGRMTESTVRRVALAMMLSLSLVSLIL